MGAGKMKATKVTALWTATGVATIGLAAAAHADNVIYQFQAPPGNIACIMGNSNGGNAFASCQINGFTYQRPPPPPGNCPGWGALFRLDQGNPAYMGCKGDPLVYPPPPTLDWEKTQSVGPISCQNSMGDPAQSVPASTLCRDNSTGHYFRVGTDRYNLG